MKIMGRGTPMVVFFRAANMGGYQKFQPKSLAGKLSQFDIVNIGAAGFFVVRKSVPEAVLRKEFLRRLFNASVENRLEISGTPRNWNIFIALRRSTGIMNELTIRNARGK